ncbi:MAG: bifunctional UDP-N-acetylglucosamine diphosphorylase/glucosamine-1-phosphate N-acetyltransferase GlmU [Ostreibacterium sp.]
MAYGIVILAAGKGNRMKSTLPKVLHSVGGKPMVLHLVDRANDLQVRSPIIISGHEGEKLKNTLGQQEIQWVEQTEQLGTAHAVLQALPYLDKIAIYLILVGDAPLIRTETLQALGKSAEQTGIAVLTVSLNKPFGYGRIIRHVAGHVDYIVEEKDANTTEKAVSEINSGVFAIRGDLLQMLLPKIGNDNAQGEYYLTDIVTLANQAKHLVAAHRIDDETEVLGCNDKIQLSQLERVYQRRQADLLMAKGLTLADPDRIDIRGTLQTGTDCKVDINCIFEGEVCLGDNVIIEANCILRNTQIDHNTHIKANTIIENAVIGQQVNIGPFARIRPNTELADNTKVGNFVETKNAKIAQGSKVNHLSYVGDAIIGENVNIGAGTITCNYDGANKHQTVIEQGAFIGSNTALVAPVTVGAKATIGAGSTITKAVAPMTLALTRPYQTAIEGWQRPMKKK